MKLRILLSIMALLLTGCITVEVCNENSDSELVARFKSEKAGSVTDSTVSALTLYGIREGLPDSLLYDSVRASGFVAPLDPRQDSCRFMIQVDSLWDTLTIHYQREIYMISYTCGFATLFTLDSLESDTGLVKRDSIINRMIDVEYETNEVHIWLYL